MNWNEFDAELAKAGTYQVYESSRDSSDGILCAMVRSENTKLLAVTSTAAGFEGTDYNGIRLCPLTTGNAKALMKLFAYTKPRSHKGKNFTIGLGDRLGVATPGQLKALKGYDVFPVLAQQSIRELTLTNRTFEEVIAAAAFGVFQAGYKSGYGADGDHLKTKKEISYALESGCTMITLDCSEHIKDEAAEFAPSVLDAEYRNVPAQKRDYYEAKYLGKKLPIIGELQPEELRRIVLVFSAAIEYAIDCYNYIMKTADHAVDFELSIDEAMAITTPAEHLIIAMELNDAGVVPVSVAPHFTGYFEKGIEYQGNLDKFAQDLEIHQKIADKFKYKLSLHSGSDKFSVFSVLYRVTKGRVHVKTAGTNWLEAVRVMAKQEPELYRAAHKFALAHYSEAAKYYHVTTDPATIPNIDLLSNAYLPELLELPASRQLMHISYGLLLAEPWFRDAFYAMLHRCEQEYMAGLEHHIGRHLRYLTEN